VPSYIKKYVQPSFSWLGLQDHASVMTVIQSHAKQQQEHIICCEHIPIYTTGRRRIDNRKQTDLPAPLVVSDRGGETTFHGPGQLMFYPIINIAQRQLAVSCYVSWLEKSCIQLCRSLGVTVQQRQGFPGVWVEHAKIAAVGLRVRHGMVYHGMSLNVHVDSLWFDAILGCGLSTPIINLNTLTTQELVLEKLAKQWHELFCRILGDGCGTI